jgi:hypothetical protein
MMRVNAYAAGSSSPLGVNILVAEGSIGPRPASTHHQCLEVVFASKADCDRAVILVVVVHLVARHRTASDESNKGLGRHQDSVSPRLLLTLMKPLYPLLCLAALAACESNAAT